MKKSIVELIKSNKEVIIKKSLIVGGTIAGLFVVGALLKSEDEDIVIDTVEDQEGNVIEFTVREEETEIQE